MQTATRTRQNRGRASGKSLEEVIFNHTEPAQTSAEQGQRWVNRRDRATARNKRPGQVVTYVPFAHSEGLLPTGSPKFMRVVSNDNTARGVLDAAHEKQREMGIRPGRNPFILDVPAGERGQGPFRGADLRGVVIRGHMPDLRGAATRGTVFYKAAGGLVGSGNDLSNAAFNQSSAYGAQLAWANMNGLRVSGGSTGIRVDAPHAYMGALFDYTSGNLGRATVVPVVPGDVARNYVSFSGANLKMNGNGIQLAPAPAVVTSEDRNSLARLAGKGELTPVLRHGLPKGPPVQADNDNPFQSHVRARRPDELPPPRNGNYRRLESNAA